MVLSHWFILHLTFHSHRPHSNLVSHYTACKHKQSFLTSCLPLYIYHIVHTAVHGYLSHCAHNFQWIPITLCTQLSMDTYHIVHTTFNGYLSHCAHNSQQACVCNHCIYDYLTFKSMLN